MSTPASGDATLADCPPELLDRALRASAEGAGPIAIIHDPIGCAEDSPPDWNYCPIAAAPVLCRFGHLVAVLCPPGTSTLEIQKP